MSWQLRTTAPSMDSHGPALQFRFRVQMRPQKGAVTSPRREACRAQGRTVPRRSVAPDSPTAFLFTKVAAVRPEAVRPFASKPGTRPANCTRLHGNA